MRREEVAVPAEEGVGRKESDDFDLADIVGVGVVLGGRVLGEGVHVLAEA